MDEIRVSAKTVEAALTEACVQLGISSDQVEYEIIEKGTTGFLGIGAKQAVINVRRKRPEKPVREEKAAVKKEKKADKYDFDRFDRVADKFDKKTEDLTKKEEKTFEKVEKKAEKAVEKEVKKEVAETIREERNIVELTEEEANDIKEKASSFLSDVFAAMKMEVKVDVNTDNKSRLLNIELSGDNMGILIGKHGQNLNSLEYLVRLVVNKNHHGDDYIHVKLDTENYRKRRKSTLEGLARNMAYKVKRSRKSIALEPMNPYERRVIHSALQHDRYVETYSEGNEPNRHVVITLKKYNR